MLNVVLESGLGGSPQSWSPVVQLLEPEFRVAIHARGSSMLLPEIAQELRAELRRAGRLPPYLLVGHSFGALVVRQFAALYPCETAAVLFVDGLPLATQVPASTVVAAHAALLVARLGAYGGLVKPLLPMLAKHVRQFDWAFQELRKLPLQAQAAIQAEWATPQFYSRLARELSALPRNLHIACRLPKPENVLSLHSDYPDPDGLRVEHSGHWIQIDRPDAVVTAVHWLARAILIRKGA